MKILEGEITVMITIITALVTATVLCGVMWALRKEINNIKNDLKNVNDDIVYRENKIDDRIYRVCNRVSAIEGGKHWLVVRYDKCEFDEENSYYVEKYLTKFIDLTPYFDTCDRIYLNREDVVKALSIVKDSIAINQFTGEKIEGEEYQRFGS